jgi:Major Facilitator Superfamily
MESRVRNSYWLCHLLDAPLFAMYGMFQFVLTKELFATAFQITLYITLKPVAALVSSYWSNAKRGSIRNHLIVLSCVATLPPMLFPLFPSTWFGIAAFGIYFVADRAAMTGWMEIIRRHIPRERSGWAVSRNQLTLFLVGSFLPLLVAPGLDRGWIDWRWLFFALALLSMARVAVLCAISLPDRSRRVASRPMGEVFKTLVRRPDFAYFQLIFFFGGLGLMMALAVVPDFVGRVLQLSYTDLALAFAFAKGLGFGASARIWSWVIHRVNIFAFCSLVALLAAVSVALIPCSLYWHPFLHIALFVYGVMQGGSTLGWQLSGPAFSGDEDSTPYVSANVMSVGVRGCFGPSLGVRLGLEMGPVAAFGAAAFTCLTGSCIGLVGHFIWGRTKAPEPA